eukprot:TRINITY_DN289_c0_g1_i2.p1 TRINITY_DN289_c0_g1~~TRINITY_DN289_c0_g1_i2.p1  ORF type:complete len:626 (+),score=194.73 TRINITY_DN289_c0_g1_i2:201-1880(+)
MASPMLMNPSIILLKEGTDTSQGIGQIVSNINACCAIVDTIKTTLGPRGMDKLVYEDTNKVTISNDGATIMKLLDVVHPAAKSLVDIAKSQDSEVGDGTTSVVVLAGEFLKEAKPFIEDGVHSQVIIRAYRRACELAKNKIKEMSVNIDTTDKGKMRDYLEKCAGTAMNSKLICSHKDFFTKMVVDAVQVLDDDLDIHMIGVKKENGGAMEDTIFVEGVAFKKTFSYAGFEQQPKRFDKPSILCLNIELELKAERDNAEIRLKDVEQYQSLVDAEWRILYEKMEKMISSGANIVLSKLPIGDVATQYFADRGVFCAGRVVEEDLKRVCKATGAAIQTTVNNIIPSVLGTCALFEERQVGGNRYNIFSGCEKATSATIILRGGGDQFIEEAERSLHDAIMIVRRARKTHSVVAGGGAIEMEVSKYLKEQSNTIHGKQQLLMKAFAKSLEVIPRQLADNAGFDSTDLLNQLRQKHGQGGKWFGVDITNESICDTFEKFVWEPTLIKINCYTAATEAACLILSVDETVRNSASEKPQAGPLPGGGRGMRGMGRGVRAMRGRR